MVHTVPIREFCATVREELGAQTASITRIGSQIVVTATNEDACLIIRSVTEGALTSVRESLEKEGFSVRDGQWTLGDQAAFGTFGPLVYISAISYLASPGKPGVWVDAFPDPITPAQAIRAMYDELCTDGDVQDMSYEEFVDLARPHAVVVPPAELEDFLKQKIFA